MTDSTICNPTEYLDIGSQFWKLTFAVMCTRKDKTWIHLF